MNGRSHCDLRSRKERDVAVERVGAKGKDWTWTTKERVESKEKVVRRERQVLKGSAQAAQTSCVAPRMDAGAGGVHQNHTTDDVVDVELPGIAPERERGPPIATSARHRPLVRRVR